METFQRFIKLGDDRINVEEIVCYGLGVDDADESYLYIETKTSEDIFRYYEEDADFELEDKLNELDGLLLIKKLGHVDFKRKQL
ncbi:MAG: hypothetical protein IKZ53_10145 [Selenomonadaceae bacterium]|nr:hypothetical protein [Selenomonadaceae bacterium]